MWVAGYDTSIIPAPLVAFTIAVGPFVVDDAGEKASRHIEEGEKPLEAALKISFTIISISPSRWLVLNSLLAMKHQQTSVPQFSMTIFLGIGVRLIQPSLVGGLAVSQATTRNARPAL